MEMTAQVVFTFLLAVAAFISGAFGTGSHTLGEANGKHVMDAALQSVEHGVAKGLQRPKVKKVANSPAAWARAVKDAAKAAKEYTRAKNEGAIKAAEKKEGTVQQVQEALIHVHQEIQKGGGADDKVDKHETPRGASPLVTEAFAEQLKDFAEQLKVEDKAAFQLLMNTLCPHDLSEKQEQLKEPDAQSREAIEEKVAIIASQSEEKVAEPDKNAGQLNQELTTDEKKVADLVTNAGQLQLKLAEAEQKLETEEKKVAELEKNAGQLQQKLAEAATHATVVARAEVVSAREWKQKLETSQEKVASLRKKLLHIEAQEASQRRSLGYS